VKEKQAVGSPYFGAFSSDRIPKARKNVNGTFLYSHFYLQIWAHNGQCSGSQKFL
jgi:hypothetical protein